MGTMDRYHYIVVGDNKLESHNNSEIIDYCETKDIAETIYKVNCEVNDRYEHFHIYEIKQIK